MYVLNRMKVINIGMIDTANKSCVVSKFQENNLQVLSGIGANLIVGVCAKLINLV